MSGLVKKNLINEMRAEISWLSRAVTQLAERAGVESYELTLLKYHIEPEVASAIEHVVFLMKVDTTLHDDDVFFQRVANRVEETVQTQYSLDEELDKEMVLEAASQLRKAVGF